MSDEPRIVMHPREIRYPIELPYSIRHPLATEPHRAHPFDAGLDLFVAAVAPSPPWFQQIWYDTGVAVAIPYGCVGLVFPLDSIDAYPIRMTHAVGVINPSDQETIVLKFDMRYPGNEHLAYHVGDKCGQLVVVPILILRPTLTHKLPELPMEEGGY